MGRCGRLHGGASLASLVLVGDVERGRRSARLALPRRRRIATAPGPMAADLGAGEPSPGAGWPSGCGRQGLFCPAGDLAQRRHVVVGPGRHRVVQPVQRPRRPVRAEPSIDGEVASPGALSWPFRLRAKAYHRGARRWPHGLVHDYAFWLRTRLHGLRPASPGGPGASASTCSTAAPSTRPWSPRGGSASRDQQAR